VFGDKNLTMEIRLLFQIVLDTTDVLYKREISSYYFVELSSGGSRVLKVIQKADKLNVSSLVAIVESLLGEETKYGREESNRIKYG
jgi:hypothetical protein